MFFIFNNHPIILFPSLFAVKFLFYILYFILYPPSSGIAPCVGTAGMVQTTTLDAAMLSSSRAGADLGRPSDIDNKRLNTCHKPPKGSRVLQLGICNNYYENNLNH